MYTGGGGSKNTHERTFIYRSAYALMEYLGDSVGRVHVENLMS